EQKNSHRLLSGDLILVGLQSVVLFFPCQKVGHIAGCNDFFCFELDYHNLGSEVLFDIATLLFRNSL
ncbi:MAG: hypothetical protein Q4D44_07430, partial [Eubacteriales bacterium]|nr:hypothetical protein [Eubacteriales bacterium]